MILQERFEGRELLFQGDRSLSLRRIPVGAKIVKAQATIIPVTASGGTGSSEDDIIFTNSTNGEQSDHGEILTLADQIPGWVEIDFHRRVTLISISGSDFNPIPDNPPIPPNPATLQVDIGGGTFVEINDKGAFKEPGGNDFMLSNVNPSHLPGLTVNRIKLTQSEGLVLAVTSVKVRNVATNVSLRIGESPPFFLQPGDLAEKQSTVDFTELLQANLQTLIAKDGFYEVPIVLHSDRLTRLDLEVNIELINQQQVLPRHIGEIQFPYAYNAVSESNNKRLMASIPVGARIVSDATEVNIEGSFTNSKIVLGSFDELGVDVNQVGVDTEITQAQAFTLNSNQAQQELTINAIDLLLTSISSQASLQLDLRADLDGKPDNISLLTETTSFDIATDNASTPVWISVALNKPITLAIKDQLAGTKYRYWLLIQSLAGEAQWSIGQSTQASFVGLQQSKDGGMSWRETIVSSLTTRAKAQFRLRQNSQTFHIPIEVKIGSDEQAKRLNLAQFEPLGRIDFALDSEQFSNTINDFIQETEPLACPQGEQLINSEFDLEFDLDPNTITLVNWELTGGSINPYGNPQSGINLSDNDQTSGLSQIIPVVESCNYELTVIASIDGVDSRVELIWSGNNCAPIRIDELILTQDRPLSGDVFSPIYRLRSTSPELATQVEVRLITPISSYADFDKVSLVASPQSIANSDLLEIDGEGIASWSNFPVNAFEKMLRRSIINGSLQITNDSSFLQPAILSQFFQVQSGTNFNLEFEGTAIDCGEAMSDTPSSKLSNVNSIVFPEIRLLFSQNDNDDSNSNNNKNSLIIRSNNSTSHQLTGVIPESAREAEIQLVIPKETVLTINNVSFRSHELRDIPITFLSEAPGDLTVSNLNIGFEMQQVPLPKLPETGLCRATPADTMAGDDCENDDSQKCIECYCYQCSKPTELMDIQAILSINDRPGIIGRCRDCGLSLVQYGGIASADAIFLPIRQITYSMVELDDSKIPLSEVDYIGEVRTRSLNENGIMRMGELALADPVMLMEILNISDGLAESLVAQAKKILFTLRRV